MGSDDLFKKRRTSKEKRTQANRGQSKDRILILCEGEKTEPNYFNGFLIDYRLTNVKICGCGKNTDNIVEIAIKRKKDYEQVWCVFDRDSFPAQNFNRAFQLAELHKKIKIAYSNEAFELWYLLHFNYHDVAWNRSLFEDRLKELLGHKYLKNSKTMYNELLNRQQTAIDNAKRLIATYSSSNPEQDNPSTTVHLLVEELNKYRN